VTKNEQVLFVRNMRTCFLPDFSTMKMPFFAQMSEKSPTKRSLENEKRESLLLLSKHTSFIKRDTVGKPPPLCVLG